MCRIPWWNVTFPAGHQWFLCHVTLVVKGEGQFVVLGWIQPSTAILWPWPDTRPSDRVQFPIPLSQPSAVSMSEGFHDLCAVWFPVSSAHEPVPVSVLSILFCQGVPYAVLEGTYVGPHMLCADPTESFSMGAGILTAFGTGLEGTDPGSDQWSWQCHPSLVKGQANTRGVSFPCSCWVQV